MAPIATNAIEIKLKYFGFSAKGDMESKLRFAFRCQRQSWYYVGLSFQSFSEISCEQIFTSFFTHFRIYDIDNDGFVSNGELFQVKLKKFFQTWFQTKETCWKKAGAEDDGGEQLERDSTAADCRQDHPSLRQGDTDRNFN